MPTSEWHERNAAFERAAGNTGSHLDEHGNEHWHAVPTTGQFRLKSCCDGCDALMGDES